MLENILNNIGKMKPQVVELCFEPGLMSELQEGTECLEHEWQGKSKKTVKAIHKSLTQVSSNIKCYTK